MRLVISKCVDISDKQIGYSKAFDFESSVIASQITSRCLLLFFFLIENLMICKADFWQYSKYLLHENKKNDFDLLICMFDVPSV